MSPPAQPSTPSATRLWLTWSIFTVIAVVLAWRIVSVNLAEHYATIGEPDRALALHPEHFAALEAAALEVFETEPARALALLEQSIAANPARGITYARVGALRELHGDADLAASAIDAAVRLAPAQVDVRLIAAAIALGRDDLAGVLEHWDVAMTRRGALRQALYPVLLAFAEHPENLVAFHSLVGARELSWWPWFVAYAANNAERLDTTISLFQLTDGAEFNRVGGQPLNAVLRRLQRDGFWLDARLAWMNSVPEAQLDGMGNLFNGRFEHPISDVGFDWVRQRAGHIVVETAPTDGATGAQALHVHFRGPRVQYRHLSQLVVLPAGDYVLRGNVRPDGFEAVHGLMWTIACVGSRERRIGETPHFKGRSPWRGFEASFSVPPEDCPAQRIRLQLDGRVPLDFEASGSVWFDAMAIEPAPPLTQANGG